MTRRLAVLPLLLAVACSKGGGDARAQAAASVEPSLAAYLTRLAELSPKETSAIEAVMAHSGVHYTDDQALLTAVSKIAVPRYREFVAGLRAFQPPEGKVREIHGRLTHIATQELAVLERLQVALERGDGTTVLFVNREHARLREEMDRLLQDLKP